MATSCVFHLRVPSSLTLSKENQSAGAGKSNVRPLCNISQRRARNARCGASWDAQLVLCTSSKHILLKERRTLKFHVRPLCNSPLRVRRAGNGSCGAASCAMQDSLPDPLECLPGSEMGPSMQGMDVNLLYGEYMDHLWVALKEKISGLRLMDLLPEYRVQKTNKGRVHNWWLSGDRVRRVRITYFDGGAAGQAFNSLLYPDTRYDLPLLGIDLLSFGSNKILCVVDFQPLIQDPDYLERHTSVLAPVYERIREQCGHMSTKFFDETQFFSKYLVFYRSKLGPSEPTLRVPTGRLWEVYLEYVDIYLNALNNAQGNEAEDARAYVQSRQDAYDQYNAERDPAIKLFNSYFGTEWSERFTKDFLFPGATL